MYRRGQAGLAEHPAFFIRRFCDLDYDLAGICEVSEQRRLVNAGDPGKRKASTSAVTASAAALERRHIDALNLAPGSSSRHYMRKESPWPYKSTRPRPGTILAAWYQCRFLLAIHARKILASDRRLE